MPRLAVAFIFAGVHLGGSQHPSLLTICTSWLASSQLGGPLGTPSCPKRGSRGPDQPGILGDEQGGKGGTEERVSDTYASTRALTHTGVHTHRHAHKDPRLVCGLCSWRACVPIPMRALRIS